MELTEGIDYHIREIGKYLELTSVTLPGFAAGIVNLTRRSYEINLNATTNIGSLLMAKTIPKVAKPKKKKVAEVKSTKKVVIADKE